jgi:hypothetical protein
MEPKSKLTHLLRQAILNRVQNIQQTTRTEGLLIELSFQSTVNPERHVWIGVYGLDDEINPDLFEKEDSQEICIDCEDWSSVKQWENSDDWYDTIEEHITVSIEEAVQIVDRWLNKLD